jgi:hypothetical protein
MTNPEYQNLVTMALYAMEHGFQVEYVGAGDLLIRQIPQQKEQ